MGELNHLSDFQKILSNYHISDAGKTLLHKVTFVPLVGIASSGRNTIIRELVKTGRYHYIVSDTTRPKRINDGVMEQDGVEYWFRTEDDVLADLQAGKFLEAAIIHNQQVSGISLRELQRAAEAHQTATSDMEVQGVDNIMQTGAPIVPIFILPPSYDEWQRRLTARGHMSEQELQNRKNSARAELAFALEHDYYHFVVNDDLSKTVYVVDKIASGHESARHAAEAKQVAGEILTKLVQ